MFFTQQFYIAKTFIYISKLTYWGAALELISFYVAQEAGCIQDRPVHHRADSYRDGTVLAYIQT